MSGRDDKSVTALATLLETLDNPRTRPHDVARVRDPVLSDSYFTDTDGQCWRQDHGELMPTVSLYWRVCFVARLSRVCCGSLVVNAGTYAVCLCSGQSRVASAGKDRFAVYARIRIT